MVPTITSDAGLLAYRELDDTLNNLKNVSAFFPLGCFICVTGVSGSGKSTLVDDILRRALFRHFYNAKEKPGAFRGLRGVDQIDKAIVIDQSAIGRTPRSNPITYSGAFTPIRELFAQLPAARVRAMMPDVSVLTSKAAAAKIAKAAD